MGADLISLAVAGIGVVGALGATVAAQWAGLRGKRLDAEIQQSQQNEHRAESMRQQEREQKHSVYSEFNSAARNYRMHLHHCVMELERGSPADVDRLESERGHYREMYAQAQMVVPDRVLAVASEVDLCLGNTYRAVHHMIDHADADVLVTLHQWLDGPGSEAMWLLRQVLREDLGVTVSATDLDAKVAALSSARVEQFDAGAGALSCNLKGDIGSQ
ncbi:hypothetical protein ABZ540_07455 [Nocardia xishanensis]|uniref:hypothetical protein n=1 Tax=Nocardia xishanensis TaxID=238964 RepID=UPI00340CB18E